MKCSDKIKCDRVAQVWSLDFIIAISIFLVVITFYFKYASEHFNEIELEFEELQLDVESISDSLLTQGYPADWNPANVKRIGICNDGYAINQTKLEQFLAMDYNLTRQLFRIRNQYYFFIRDADGQTIAQAGVNATPSMLASAERVVLYNNITHRMSVYAWKG